MSQLQIGIPTITTLIRVYGEIKVLGQMSIGALQIDAWSHSGIYITNCTIEGEVKYYIPKEMRLIDGCTFKDGRVYLGRIQMIDDNGKQMYLGKDTDPKLVKLLEWYLSFDNKNFFLTIIDFLEKMSISLVSCSE